MVTTDIRFGTFEVDPVKGELRKNGTRIRLQEQPFRLLLVLLERPDEVVSSEELRHRLWAGDTFVEFDKALSTAIHKLRDALGDDAANPRFIETVPRRGYRFIAPVDPAPSKLDALVQEPDRATRGQRRVSPSPWLLLLLVAFGAAGLALKWISQNEQTLKNARLAIGLPAGLFFPGETSVVISPDGQSVVFVAQPHDGERRLYKRRFDEFDAHEIPGSIGAKYPFFSHDGNWIAFWRQSTKAPRGELLKVPLRGGSKEVICQGWMITAGAWGRDDQIVYPDRGGGLRRVAASPQTTQDCAKTEIIINWPPQTNTSYIDPVPVPGKDFMLLTKRTPGKIGIYAVSLKTGEEKLVLSGGMHGQLAMGYLFFTADRLLKAVAFDVDRLETVGSPRVIAEDLKDHNPSDLLYAVAENGTVVFLRGIGASQSLVWKDRAGRSTRLPVSARRYATPALSPDGTRLAVRVQEGPKLRIWVGSIFGEPLAPITFLGDEWYPIWSADGERVLFTSGVTKAGTYKAFWTAADGSGSPEQVTDSPVSQFANSWSAKNNALLITQPGGPGKGYDIWEVLPGSGEPPRPFIASDFGETGAHFSPDGTWVAYQSNESGRAEVYVLSYPDGRFKQQISVGGGQWAAWRGDGRELFYVSENDTMMAVPIDIRGRILRPGVPQPLFHHARTSSDIGRDYDVTHDGQRFLLVDCLDDDTTKPEVNVVLGLSQELRWALK